MTSLRFVLFLIMVISMTSSLPHVSYAKDKFRPNSVPDTMPDAIRVKLDNTDLCQRRNIERAKLVPPLPVLNCTTGESYDPTTYTMDEYTLGVLKAEVGSDATTPSWHIQVLMGLAVTIRSYTWTHGTAQPDGTLEMGSTTNAQTFFPEKSTGQNYPDAVAQTTGQYLYHPDGEGTAGVITANYSRQHGPNAGTFYTVDGGKPYLKSIYDPILGDISGSKGHGWGLAQLGAYYWAIGQDSEGKVFPQLNYLQILAHYFTGVEVRNIYGQILVPDYRWNPLILNWGNGAVAPPSMRYGGNGVYQVAVTLQNTGTAPWTHVNQGGAARWYLSYRWRKGSRLQEGNRVEVAQSGQAQTVAEGEHRVVTLTVYDPPDWGAGEYLLQLDMLYETQATGNIIWFSDEQESRWFSYDLKITPTFCTPGSCGGGEVYLPYISVSIPTPEPPLPTDCVWEGNHLKNSIFSLGDNPLRDWVVWIDTSETMGCFTNTKLYDTGNYYSPDSGAAGAFLGGENDCHQPDGGDNNDQYIYFVRA